MKIIIIALIIFLVIFLFKKITAKFKFPKINALAVFTGAVKVGKTGVSLACARSVYRLVHFRWKLSCFFRKLFNKELLEEPLFYSNIPLRNMKYYELTLEHILRKVRFNFGSVVFVDEASLLADCYISKDKPQLSTELLKFFKLFGHETHCGTCIFNSQQISDLHIALRKCTSQYFYIHNTSSKYIPFISYCYMREERYSEDGSTVNTYNEDIENTLRTVIFRKSTFKKYDPCCYSILTDNLPVCNVEMFNTKYDSIKANKIVSFRSEFATLFDEINKLKESQNVIKK